MFAVLVQPHLELYTATFHGDEQDSPQMDFDERSGYDWDADDAPWRHLNYADMVSNSIRLANGIDEPWRRE